jgi:hypothetical protein
MTGGMDRAPLPRMLASLVAIVLLCGSASARRQPVQTVALLPLDDRPVCTQMPEMLGSIAGIRVLLPPAQYLGRFTKAGDCAKLAEWLKTAAGQADGLIVSTDMLCYGGLVASRDDSVPESTALARLRILDAIHAARPDLPILAFGSITRTAATATRSSASWRMALAYYLMYKDRAAATGSKSAARLARIFLRQVPKGEVARHERTRRRNSDVLLAVVNALKSGTVSFVIVGQDDAEPYGPHRVERERLRKALDRAGFAGRAIVCGGIDQVACPLLARFLLRAANLRPRIFIDWAGQAGRSFVPRNEGQSVDRAMQAQIYGAGARPAASPADADILLFTNTRKRSAAEFGEFRSRLTAAVEEGKLVAVADLNQTTAGEGDVMLLRYLLESRLCGRLAGYAGWNTVSNALGTAVSQATMYWLARRNEAAPTRDRELSHREFILQRFACDYGYQNYIRPLAYDFVTEDLHSPRDEIRGAKLDLLVRFVSKQAVKLLETYFRIGFQGTTFPSGPNGEVERITQLTGVSVGLPWPRAYEISMSFQFQTEPVASGMVSGSAGQPPVPTEEQKWQGDGKSSGSGR